MSLSSAWFEFYMLLIVLLSSHLMNKWWTRNVELDELNVSFASFRNVGSITLHFLMFSSAFALILSAISLLSNSY